MELCVTTSLTLIDNSPNQSNYILEINIEIPVGDNLAVNKIGDIVIGNSRILVFDAVDVKTTNGHFTYEVQQHSGGEEMDFAGATNVAIVYSDSKGNTGTATRNYADHNILGSKA